MNSITWKGKVLDFKYKKQLNFAHNFYIGDIFVGQLYKMGKGNWSAVSWVPHDICPVNGFKSRYHASEFLLKLNGFVPK